MTQQENTLTKPVPVAVKATAPTLVKRPVPVLKVVSIHDIANYVNMLIIGPQGAGKTLLTTSAAADPRVEGILYIDADRGAKTGIDYIHKYPNKFTIVYVGDDEFAPPKPLDDMRDFIRYARIATDRQRAQEEHIPYVNTIVIDSVSFLADKVIAYLSGNYAAIENGQAPRAAQIQEWGTQKSFIESWINTFKDLPCHVIVTCHEHLGEDEVTKVKVPQLLLPGKLGSKLPALFDEVLWLGVDKTAPANDDGTQPRVLLCQANKERNAKDRSRKLPSKLANPTITMLFDKFFTVS